MADTKNPPLVAVAGSTGWLGNHVVNCLLERGYAVRALVLPETKPPQIKAEAATRVQVHFGDVTDADWLKGFAENAVSVISCVGMGDLGAPDAAFFSLLMGGTINLWNEAVRAKVKTFVTIGSGIHKTPSGQVNREMIENAAREPALDAIQQEIQAANERNLHLPSVVVVDGNAFFKDMKSMFDMIASADPPSLRLVAGSWTLPFNPISGRDLAAHMVDSCGIVADSTTASSTDIKLPTFTRRTAGGTDIVTFAELADAVGKHMGFSREVRKQSIPQPLAWILLLVTKGLAALGSTKAMKANRLLGYLWVIGTDISPTGLVGEINGSRDGILSYYEELAKEKKAAAD